MSQSLSFNSQITHEQLVIDKIFRRFDFLLQNAWEKLRHIRKDDVGSTFAARSERDSFATHYEDSIEQFKSSEDNLVFGSLKYQTNVEGKDSTRYIGRLGLKDDNMESLLVDWRSGAGGDFYSATTGDNRGVDRRRHIITSGRKVVGVEDELLNVDSLESGSNDIIGEGALFAAMTRDRTDQMTDIVATIQKEQDSIIRASMNGVQIIQGGPGTGKTAVALHRVAYLLYHNREALSNGKVLILGPSSNFLKYISNVLPSLGESGVFSTTISGLLTDIINSEDLREATDEEALLKGGVNQESHIKNELRKFRKKLNQDVSFRTFGEKYVLTTLFVNTTMTKISKKKLLHNDGRREFVKAVIQNLMKQYDAHRSRDEEVFDDAQTLENQRNEIRKDFIHNSDLRKLLNLLWMPLTPKFLIGRIYYHNQKDNEFKFSNADIALIDYASTLLGDIHEAKVKDDKKRFKEEVKYAKSILKGVAHEAAHMIDAQTLANRHFQESVEVLPISQRKFRHIVIDEAQELSYMELRMIMRRTALNSLTLVGDIAQTSTPAGVSDWDNLINTFVEHGVTKENIHYSELSINYRNPQEIATLATSTALENGLIVKKTKSPRSVPDSVVYADSLHIVADLLKPLTGSSAVIHPRNFDIAQLKEISSQYLTAEQSKGLEYDNVVVINPTEILKESTRGASDLYVAMTRATNKLIIVGV